jgi:hypothetical protein
VANISDKAYIGKQIKPAVVVTTNGQTLRAGTDYTVTYGANKNIGKGSVTVTGTGKYKGSKTVSFNVVPQKNSVSKTTVGKRQMKVAWRKVSSAQKVTRYQVRYRVRGTAKWTTKSYASSLSSATIKKLRKGKAYDVQVRSYKTVSGVNYCSVWSATRISGKIK